MQARKKVKELERKLKIEKKLAGGSKSTRKRAKIQILAKKMISRQGTMLVEPIKFELTNRLSNSFSMPDGAQKLGYSEDEGGLDDEDNLS